MNLTARLACKAFRAAFTAARDQLGRVSALEARALLDAVSAEYRLDVAKACRFELRALQAERPAAPLDELVGEVERSSGVPWRLFMVDAPKRMDQLALGVAQEIWTRRSTNERT